MMRCTSWRSAIIHVVIIATFWCAHSVNHWSSILTRAKKDLANALAGNADSDTAVENGPQGERRPVTDTEIAALVEQANAQLRDNDINGVLESFFSVLDADPTRHDINTVMGSILSSVGQFELAEGFLFSAVQLSNWTYIPAVASLADTLRLDNEPVLAEQVASKGLSAGGVDGKELLQAAMGHIMVQAEKYSAAADWFLAAALTRPASVEYWLKASTMLFPSAHRDYTFAANVLSEAMKTHANEPQLLYQTALVLHSTSRVADAIPLYEHSIRVDPDNARPPALPALATAYHAVRRFPEARAAYNRAVQLEPSNVVLLANYALLLCSDDVGERDTGLAVLQQAKAMDANNADVIRADAECASSRVREGQQQMMVGEL